MKKIFFSMLLPLALLSGIVHGQTTITITLPDNFPDKAWVEKKIKEASLVVSPEPAKTDPCAAGPVITSISDVSGNQLKLTFHGEGVFKITWYIRDALGKLHDQGEVSPENNSPVINVKFMAPGAYVLAIAGKSCTSLQSTKPFVVSGSGLVVDPPTKPAGNGVTIAKGMDEHMKLSFTRDGDQYLISDQAKADLSDGYEYRYIIGSEIVLTGNPIKNYPLYGLNPSRILKFKTKIGLKTLNMWENEPGVSYYDRFAGQTFSFNTTAALNTFFFPGVKSGFVSHIPDWYDPAKENTQWADNAPDMKLPAGHVWISSPEIWGIEHVMKKGVTHISNFQLPWADGAPYTEVIRLRDAGLTYTDVPRIETFLNLKKVGENDYSNGWNKAWWPNGPLTKEQAIQKANEADITHAVWIAETEENEAWMFNDVEMWGHFYARLRERYEERFGKRGIPYYIAHNYYHLWGSDLNLNGGKGKDYYKKILTLPASQIPSKVYAPRGVLSSTNLIVEGVYLSAPDLSVAQPYELLFHLQLIKKLGYEAGVFLAGVHEWKPNNWIQYSYPEGAFFATSKIPLDPALHMANGFLAQVFGKLYVEWGGASKTLTRNWEQEYNPGLWIPTGAATPQPGFPYYWKSGEKYIGYIGSTDISYFSQKLFVDSYGIVEGGTDQFLRFRIDGGSWITPSANDYVDAYFDKRGFVHSRRKNGRTAWFYLNCFADNSRHEIEVELPDGRIRKEIVSGNGIHTQLL